MATEIAQPQIKIATDENRNKIALIPLNRGKWGYAIINFEDLQFLQELGLSFCWSKLPRVGYITAPAFYAPGFRLSPARVLMDAGPRQVVRYRNGDVTDLRKANLFVEEGGSAKRRDREHLRPRRKAA
jgi:hypothetical protein